MKGIGKIIGLLFALAFALPASAQKLYTLSVAVVDSTTVAVTVTNVSPPTESNSTLNSFRIRSSLTLLSGSSASPSQPATVNKVGSNLEVKNFSGIKAAPLSPNSITINVKVASLACSSTWSIDGYTGNSLNGPINFSQSPPGGAQLAGNCLTIAVPPETYVTQPFPVSVGYTGPGPAPTSISVAWSCPTSTTQSVSPPYPASFNVTLGTTGPCTFTASAAGFGNASASTTVYSGTLACGGTASSSTDVDVTQDWSYPHGGTLTGGGWSLIRGENKIGPTCSSAVPYTFTLDITGKQSASFLVPSTDPQKVAAQYVIVWAPVATSGGWYEARPQVAYISNGSGPVYMPALPCTQDPTNFASLNQAQLASLMPAIPNAAPYNQEPLASTYGFSQGTNIVYAKMCVSQHGWTALGPVQSEDENGTKTLVQPWDKIIDLGDGFVSRDF